MSWKCEECDNSDFDKCICCGSKWCYPCEKSYYVVCDGCNEPACTITNCIQVYCTYGYYCRYCCDKHIAGCNLCGISLDDESE